MISLEAIGFSSAAYRLRDRWISWDAHTLDRHLGLVINNSRFFILPQVRTPNLASFLPARAVKTVCHDWQATYGRRPGTFVDPVHNRGTCGCITRLGKSHKITFVPRIMTETLSK